MNGASMVYAFTIIFFFANAIIYVECANEDIAKKKDEKFLQLRESSIYFFEVPRVHLDIVL